MYIKNMAEIGDMYVPVMTYTHHATKPEGKGKYMPYSSPYCSLFRSETIKQ